MQGGGARSPGVQGGMHLALHECRGERGGRNIVGKAMSLHHIPWIRIISLAEWHEAWSMGYQAWGMEHQVGLSLGVVLHPVWCRGGHLLCLLKGGGCRPCLELALALHQRRGEG